MPHSLHPGEPSSHSGSHIWHALRSTSPAIIMMLALALGTSGAMFTVLDGFLWRPLPYPHPRQLVLIRERLPRVGLMGHEVSFHAYAALRKGTPFIRSGGTIDMTGGPLTVHGVRHVAFGGFATPSLFRTLAVPPLLGHWLSPASGRPGGPEEAVLGYGFWKSAFAGSPAAIGERFRFNGKRFRVVGVMPRSFFTIYPGADFWIPRVLTPARLRDHNINHMMVARLSPGTSPRELNVWLEGYRNRSLAAESPAQRLRAEQDGFTIDAEPLHKGLLKIFLGGKPVLLFLLALIGLLLPLIAIVNSINLTLVRSRRRATHFAVRRALGATGMNLFQAMLVESLVTLGAVILGSLVISDFGCSLFRTLISSALTGPVSVALPFTIRFGEFSVIYGIGTALLIVTTIQLMALFFSGRESRLGTLVHEAGERGTARAARFMRRGFGAFQVLMATVLVMVGLVIFQSLINILNRPLGFDPRNRVETMVIMPHHISMAHFWTEITPALQHLPGVRHAALGFMVPFNNLMSSHSTIRSPTPPHESLYVRAEKVSRAYFRTLRIPFVAGRNFTRAEERDRATVVILSARLARRLFGTVEAVGHSFRPFGPRSPRATVVGVVGKVSWRATPATNIVGMMYMPLTYPGYKFVAGNVILKLSPGALNHLRMIQRALEGAAPGVAATHLIRLETLIRASDRLFLGITEITSVFALVALFLTIFGVYALTAQTSLNRRQEYAIRTAVGASPTSLNRMAFAEGYWMLALGLSLGVTLALFLTHLLEGVLYGIPGLDWPADVLGILIIVSTVLTASWVPVRNIAQADWSHLLKSGAA